MNRRVRCLFTHGIATEIHSVPEYSGIPGKKQADHQANLARDAGVITVIKRRYTTALNRARQISEGRSVAKVEWEADKCRKHFSDILQGKAGTRRPTPMTRV
jgi:hypothetical protein